jgi:hypothetical protein
MNCKRKGLQERVDEGVGLLQISISSLDSLQNDIILNRTIDVNKMFASELSISEKFVCTAQTKSQRTPT